MISGQKLPKPGDKKGEIIDPYVVLQVVGAECDNQKFRSKTVNDNGVCCVYIKCVRCVGSMEELRGWPEVLFILHVFQTFIVPCIVSMV